ncbi:adrenodoxin-NADP(+) reductase [Malassezia sp. CBS 17886]|nr:adrenodoxin-NADP(+) reductase [Malassezia sp. CBS 17886]
MFSPTRVARLAASRIQQAQPLRLAVIGSGPSGFYAASRMLDSFDPSYGTGSDGVEVHMYERLPTPFGLVRYGVAPDHPEVKNVEHKFDKVARDPRFRFFGNVRVTGGPAPPLAHDPCAAIALDQLAPHYTQVLFAYGASEARHLDVPGSDGALDNVYAALDFVEWYNGHPDAHAPGAPAAALASVRGEDMRRIAVVGAGNVALDVARILLKQCATSPASLSLAKTDMPEPVVACLSTWQLEDVNLYVRRGPAHVAFTNKELREMLTLTNVAFRPVDRPLLQAAQATVRESTDAGTKRAKTRLLAQLEKGSKTPWDATPTTPRWGLSFFRAPAALLGSQTLERVQWNKTHIDAAGRAQPTDDTETTQEDHLISSVGYRSTPLAGHGAVSVPFDAKRSVISNTRNRITDETGRVCPGLFVSGWLATGPVGVIVSTMVDAYGVADEIRRECAEGAATLCASVGHAEAVPGIPAALEHAHRKVVSFDDWLQIDRAEQERGKPLGKPREKFLSVDAMLRVVE